MKKLYHGTIKYRDFIARYSLMLSQLILFYYLKEFEDWPIFLALFSFHGLIAVALSSSSSKVINSEGRIRLKLSVHECLVASFIAIYAIAKFDLIGFVLFASIISVPLETHLKLTGSQFFVYSYYTLINLIVLLFFKSAYYSISLILIFRLLGLLHLKRSELLTINFDKIRPNLNAYYLNRQNILTHYLGLIFVNYDNGMILKIMASIGNLIGASLNVKNFRSVENNVVSYNVIYLLNALTVALLFIASKYSYIFALVTLIQSFVSYFMWPLFKEQAKINIVRFLIICILLVASFKNLLIGFLIYETLNLAWKKRI